MSRFGRIFTIMLMLVSVSSRAEDAHESADADSFERQQALVEQLGSPSYAEREAAAKQLTQLGLRARDVLTRNLRHKDLEVRLRVRQILSLALRDDFERRLTAFLDDDSPSNTYGFPGWDRFQKIAGRERAARVLYAEMLRREIDLLELLERPDGASKFFEARVHQLQTGMSTAGRSEPPHPASAAALLFVGAELRDTSPTTSIRMYILLNQQSLKQAILTGTSSSVLKTLLENWIQRPTATARNDFDLQLALAYDLKDTCLKLGRELLDAPTAVGRNVPYPAIAVGRFGNREEDFARLQRHIHNNTVCHTWSNPQLKKNGVIEIQSRDVVLVMLLRLTGQDPKEYGFDLLQPNPATLYHIYTYGFIENEQREAAFAKWDAWCKSMDP